MLNREEVKMYLSLHNKINERLHEIIGYYGDIDDRYYTINDIETDDSGFSISLEYYKYQDTNFDSIYVVSSLLFDDEEFEELKTKAERSVQERTEKFEAKKRDQLDQKLREARELLDKHK